MGIHSDERLKISVAQKKAIRLYYKLQTPPVGHKRIRQWFKDQYGINLPFSTISNILSAKFDHLDQLGSNHDDAKRCRPPKYPDLETALAECIGRMKTAGIDLTGAVLLNTAHELWPNIPAYHNLPIPSLSGGWVEKFKTRHRIKLRSLQVEAASTRARRSTNAAAAAAAGRSPPSSSEDSISMRVLENIRARTTHYSQNDIFTMTETHLFWRLAPNMNTLREWSTNMPRFGNKERVTVALACNASGTQRLPPYVVGQYSSPRAFQAPGSDIKSLNCVYSSNYIGWMTVTEWRAWIKWFDSLMDRRVLLIIDPHHAHETGVYNLSDTCTLQNTEIVLLPAYCASLHNPLELGILQNFKALYRKTFLSFISEFYMQGDLEGLLPSPVVSDQDFLNFNEKDVPEGIRYIDQIENPQRAINLYMAIYWIQKAWLMDMNPSTIVQAWIRANVLDDSKIPHGPDNISPTFSAISMPSGSPIQASEVLSRPAAAVSMNTLQDINRLAQFIRTQPMAQEFMGSNLDTMPPEYYIYPHEETICENVEDFILLATAQFYDPPQTEPAAADDPVFVVAPVSQYDADRAIKLLLNFEEQQPNLSMQSMQFLSDYKRAVAQRTSQPHLHTNSLSQQQQQPRSTSSIASLLDPISLPNLSPLTPTNAAMIMTAASPSAPGGPATSPYNTMPKFPPYNQHQHRQSMDSTAGRSSISTAPSSYSRANSASSTTSLGNNNNNGGNGNNGINDLLLPSNDTTASRSNNTGAPFGGLGFGQPMNSPYQNQSAAGYYTGSGSAYTSYTNTNGNGAGGPYASPSSMHKSILDSGALSVPQHGSGNGGGNGGVVGSMYGSYQPAQITIPHDTGNGSGNGASQGQAGTGGYYGRLGLPMLNHPLNHPLQPHHQHQQGQQGQGQHQQGQRQGPGGYLFGSGSNNGGAGTGSLY